MTNRQRENEKNKGNVRRIGKEKERKGERRKSANVRLDATLPSQ